MGTLYKDLSHLSDTEIEDLYQRYLTEKVATLIEDYSLDKEMSKNFISYFPNATINEICEKCGNETLFVKRRAKSSGGESPLAKCSACGHTQSHGVFTARYKVPVSCKCDFCLTEKQNAVRIKYEKIKSEFENPQYISIPFSDESAGDECKLTNVVSVIALIMSRWNNYDGKSNQYSDDFIYGLNRQQGIPFHPSSSYEDHPFIKCLSAKYIEVDVDNSSLDLFSIDEDESVRYYPFEVSVKTNLGMNGQELSIKESFQWLYQKLVDGYWYQNWDEELIDVWVDLAVAECISYAKIKADEYNFGFRSEEKISEIIRGLLKDYSVSECFYFISCAYLGAAGFHASNKSKNKLHAENTVPGKIISLASSGNVRSWTRPRELPRSAFSQILFDVILKTENDAGFRLCPYKSYQDILNKPRIVWPVNSDENDFNEPIDATSEYGMALVYEKLIELNIQSSQSSLNEQLTALALFADLLGLHDAKQVIESVVDDNQEA